MQVCAYERKQAPCVLCLTGFYLFSKGKSFRGSREDLSGIRNSFPGVSFNTLMHHKEPVGEFGVIVWPASLFLLLSWVCLALIVWGFFLLMASAGSLCLSP